MLPLRRMSVSARSGLSMGLSVPAPAAVGARAANGEPYAPITCGGFERSSSSRTPYSIGTGCEGGDPGHSATCDLVEAPAKGLVAFYDGDDDWSGLTYTPLRSGRDRFAAEGR